MKKDNRRNICGKLYFPALFPQENKGHGRVWKTWHAKIPVRKQIRLQAGANCKKQRKTFDFLFYKRQNADVLLHDFPAKGVLHYGVYRKSSFLLWKTRWKKWKTSWETALLFHKNGGKPGGKSEKFYPRGQTVTLFGCDFGSVSAILRCRPAAKTDVFPHGSFLERAAQSWYNTGKSFYKISGRVTV